MATNRAGRGMRPLFRAVWADAAAGQTDGQLLARFVARRDEAAFEALVRRHGPTVLGVCRRVLGNAADAEDAFQATFIVLLRKAAVLGGRAVLGDYLHGIARRTALKARTDAARRREKERTLVRPAPAAESRNDWLPRLDEELCRLPDKYRLPVVLCDLEGRTRREAAEQLGWPEGTVAGRLARGRALLAKRLLRAAPAGELPETFVSSLAPTSLPAALVGSTVQVAAAAAAGELIPAVGAFSLAQGVLQAMFWNKLKIAAAVVLACVLTTGVGGVTYRVAAGDIPVAGSGNSDEATDPKPPDTAEVPKLKEKPPLVREIDLTGLGAVLKRLQAEPLHNNPRRPTLLTGFDQLAQVIPDKEWQTKINGQVVFDTQRLLYFWWRDLPGDKLTYRVVEDKDEPVVVFRYTRGAVANYTVHHTRLFALAKKVGFKVEDDEKAIPPATPAVREIDLKKFKVKWPVGSVYKPTEARTAEDLVKFKFNADKELPAQLVAQVDFAKERLVFMAWSGSSGDELSVTVEEGKKGPLVFFEYAAGKTDDKVTHYRLYAVANNAGWRVDDLGKRPPAEPTGPNKDDPTAKLLKDLESEDPYVLGAAIDLLGERKAKEAIPKLIALTTDGTALIGSDNWVGLHAMHALTKITGQPFDLDEKKWRAWWKEQQKEAAGPGVAGDSAVKVLSAEATVELRGLLVHTPNGTFVMVREQRPFTGEVVGQKEGEAVTWKLEFGKKGADLEQQAKGLSGKAVVVNGNCKMVPALTSGGNPTNPSLPSGSEWRLEKTVTVSRLAASEKK